MEWGLGGLVVLGASLALLAWVVSIYNRLVSHRNKVEQAFGDIDVQLKRRHDLIPKLVDTVKGIMKHERETLDKITQARAQASSAGKLNLRLGAEAGLSALLGPFLARMEAYPEIKSNQNAMALQEELSATENRIAYVRTHFNASTLHYNNLCQHFPELLFARLFGFSVRPYYEANPAELEMPEASVS